MSSPSPFTAPGSGAWQPPSAEAINQHLDDYEVEKVLGVGGMGAVYKGYHAFMGRKVAIKVLPLAGIPDNDMKFAERFQLEAQAMAQLTHPSIITVYGCGEAGNEADGSAFLYFVMEFIEGADILEVMREYGGKLSGEHALAVTCHVLDGLIYAHDKGIIHRDIKPANVMLDQEGRVKIADFGLAKQMDADFSLTMTNMAMGTPDYVAPEALEIGASVDGRSDLYSLGTMLYQMLTGKVPRGNFKSPSKAVEGIDSRFDEIIEKALQSDPNDRYESAFAFRADLDRILTMPEATDCPKSGAIRIADSSQIRKQTITNQPATGVPEENKKNRTGLIAALILLPAIAIGAWFFWPRGNEPTPPAPAIAKVPEGNPEKSSEPAPEEPTQQGIVSDLTLLLQRGEGDESDGGRTLPTTDSITDAAPDRPFLNRQKMRFVPVPITGGPSDGQRVLFSIWETRTKDFVAVGMAPGHGETRPEMPRVNLTLAEAIAFCEQLNRTKTDREKGFAYRLPTDHEWSCAAGIGKLEDAAMLPLEKTDRVPRFTWGSTQWPPDEAAILGNTKDPRDRFDLVAPVGKFSRSELGLYDLEGNVSEWVTTSKTEDQQISRGAYFYSNPMKERAAFYWSKRIPHEDGEQTKNWLGFRVVLAPAADQAPLVPEKTQITQAKPPPKSIVDPSPDSPPEPPPQEKSQPESAMKSSDVPDVLAKPLADLQKEKHTQAVLPFHQSVNRLANSFETKIEKDIGVAAGEGNLDAVNALKQEAAHVAGFQKTLRDPVPPDQLAKLPAISADAPDEVIANRKVWNNALSKARQTFDQAAGKLDADFLTKLQQYEQYLTRQQKFDDANAVRTYREEMAKSLPKPKPPRVATGKPADRASASPGKNPYGWKPWPEDPLPLPIPTRAKTPCALVAWRIDGQAVDAESFREVIGGVPSEMGEIVDFVLFSRYRRDRNNEFNRVLSLGLTADGSVRAFRALDLQYAPGEELTDVVRLAAGIQRLGVLRADGTVRSWTINRGALGAFRDELAIHRKWENIVEVAVDSQNIVALRSDGVPLYCGNLFSSEDFRFPEPFSKNIVALGRPLNGRITLIRYQAKDGLFSTYKKDQLNSFSVDAKSGERLLVIKSSDHACLTDSKGRMTQAHVSGEHPTHPRFLTSREPSDVVAYTRSGTDSRPLLGIAAARSGEDDWRIWGESAPAVEADFRHCERRADGCWKVFIAPPYMVGLKPVVKVNAGDWTGDK